MKVRSSVIPTSLRSLARLRPARRAQRAELGKPHEHGARLEVRRVFRPGGPSFHILGFVCVFICVWCSCKYFRSRMKIILGKYYFLWSIPLYCARCLFALDVAHQIRFPPRKNVSKFIANSPFRSPCPPLERPAARATYENVQMSIKFYDSKTKIYFYRFIEWYRLISL